MGAAQQSLREQQRAAAIAIIAAVAGFGGPVGAWLIMGIGLCAVCLGTAAFKVWQQHRSVVRP